MDDNDINSLLTKHENILEKYKKNSVFSKINNKTNEIISTSNENIPNTNIEYNNMKNIPNSISLNKINKTIDDKNSNKYMQKIDDLLNRLNYKRENNPIEKNYLEKKNKNDFNIDNILQKYMQKTDKLIDTNIDFRNNKDDKFNLNTFSKNQNIINNVIKSVNTKIDNVEPMNEIEKIKMKYLNPSKNNILPNTKNEIKSIEERINKYKNELYKKIQNKNSNNQKEFNIEEIIEKNKNIYKESPNIIDMKQYNKNNILFNKNEDFTNFILDKKRNYDSNIINEQESNNNFNLINEQKNDYKFNLLLEQKTENNFNLINEQKKDNNINLIPKTKIDNNENLIPKPNKNNNLNINQENKIKNYNFIPSKEEDSFQNINTNFNYLIPEKDNFDESNFFQENKINNNSNNNNNFNIEEKKIISKIPIPYKNSINTESIISFNLSEDSDMFYSKNFKNSLFQKKEEKNIEKKEEKENEFNYDEVLPIIEKVSKLKTIKELSEQENNNNENKINKDDEQRDANEIINNVLLALSNNLIELNDKEQKKGLGLEISELTNENIKELKNDLMPINDNIHIEKPKLLSKNNSGNNIREKKKLLSFTEFLSKDN